MPRFQGRAGARAAGLGEVVNSMRAAFGSADRERFLEAESAKGGAGSFRLFVMCQCQEHWVPQKLDESGVVLQRSERFPSSRIKEGLRTKHSCLLLSASSLLRPTAQSERCHRQRCSRTE